MPIEKKGWEMHIERLRVDARGSHKRTVGQYQIYHGGKAVSGLSGWTVETRGPGDNSKAMNNRRVEAGRYPLLSQDGAKYKTNNYKPSLSPSARPKPGVELGRTNKRSEILIHPGVAFMATIGCINLTKKLAGIQADMEYVESRERIIAMIEDMKSYLGRDFPKTNGKPIPRSFVIIDGEP